MKSTLTVSHESTSESLRPIRDHLQPVSIYITVTYKMHPYVFRFLDWQAKLYLSKVFRNQLECEPESLILALIFCTSPADHRLAEQNPARSEVVSA